MCGEGVRKRVRLVFFAYPRLTLRAPETRRVRANPHARVSNRFPLRLALTYSSRHLADSRLPSLAVASPPALPADACRCPPLPAPTTSLAPPPPSTSTALCPATTASTPSTSVRPGTQRPTPGPLTLSSVPCFFPSGFRPHEATACPQRDKHSLRFREPAAVRICSELKGAQEVVGGCQMNGCWGEYSPSVTRSGMDP